jgi:phosphoglycerate kinase
MKSLKDFVFKEKRTIVRCDFNVPIEEGAVADDFRIEKTLSTIEYLKERRAKVILISHLGNPSGRDEHYSLKPIAKRLGLLLGEKVAFLKDCQGTAVEKRVKAMKGGEVILLENLRFYPGEKKNDINFAKALAKLGEIYISEAFSVSHRAHASIVQLPRLIPAGIGFLFGKEMTVLLKVREEPTRPLVTIIGGVKISSKMKAAHRLSSFSDHLLLGGQIANVVLRVKGIALGKPWPEEKIVSLIKDFKLTDTKIHLPVDVIVSPNRKGETYIREVGPGIVRKEEEIFDIGPETIETFNKIISQAKTIIWAGPLGLAEDEKFRKGTASIARKISENTDAFSLVGGGDTINSIKKLGLLDKFSYISTGGGAMLAYLTNESMPGIETLKG